MSKRTGHWLTDEDREHVAYLADLLGMEGSRRTTNLIRDIHYLARQWDSMVDRLDYCTFHLLMTIGVSLANTYLRGHGIRYAYRKNEPPVAQASLLVLVVKEVAHSSDNDFPSLRGIGLTDVESFGDRVSESMKERAADG